MWIDCAVETLVERTAKSGAEAYPPFNIEAVSDNAYRITLAVAGFREEDLSITVEDRQLVVSEGRRCVFEQYPDERRPPARGHRRTSPC